VLWTTSVTFELYLAIALGSVTHRDFLLEAPVKLPILNVNLPLAAFFVVAPVVFVIFHLHVFLQLYGLATKAREYDGLLKHQGRSSRLTQRHGVDGVRFPTDSCNTVPAIGSSRSLSSSLPWLPKCATERRLSSRPCFAFATKPSTQKP
jgi:hypothetical protein